MTDDDFAFEETAHLRDDVVERRGIAHVTRTNTRISSAIVGYRRHAGRRNHVLVQKDVAAAKVKLREGGLVSDTDPLMGFMVIVSAFQVSKKFAMGIFDL